MMSIQRKTFGFGLIIVVGLICGLNRFSGRQSREWGLAGGLKPKATMDIAAKIADGVPKSTSAAAAKEALNPEVPRGMAGELSGTAKPLTLEAGVRYWADRIEPELALEWIKQLPFKDRDNAIMALIDAWVEKDPAAAARLVVHMDSGDVHGYDATMKVARTWAKVDLETALKWMKQIDPAQNPNLRHGAVAGLAWGWMKKDFDAAFDWARKLPAGDDQDFAILGAAMAWAETDPAVAAELASKFPEDDVHRTQIINAIAKQWAMDDPAAALEWAEGLPEKDGRIARQIVAVEWARNDPKVAPRMVDMLLRVKSGIVDAEDGGLKLHDEWALNEVVWAWAKKDALAALAWAQRLPKNSRASAEDMGDPHNWYLYRVQRGWAASDPLAAAQWASQLPQGEARKESLDVVLERWASKDPESALAWIQQLPEADRDSATKSIVVGWSMKDPSAAAAAAVQLPPGESRNLALGLIAFHWTEADPPAALAWAQKLPEPDRGGALSSVVNHWLIKDREAAVRWVDQLAPGALRDKLRLYCVPVGLE